MNNLTAKLGRYKGFILGVGVSALAVSAAWGTWAILGSSTPAHQLFKGNGRLEVQRVEIATKVPGKVITVEVQEGQSFMAGDVIDLREMGVTAGNFAEKVLIETVRGAGYRLTARVAVGQGSGDSAA